MRHDDKRADTLELENMVKMYEAGYSLPNIAFVLKRHHSTIRARLIKMGIYDPTKLVEEHATVVLDKPLKYDFSTTGLSTYQKTKMCREKLTELHLCYHCRKEIDNIVWNKTHYCSLKCWKLFFNIADQPVHWE